MLKGESIECGALLVSGEFVLFSRWLIIFFVARIKVEWKFLMAPAAATAPFEIVVRCVY